MIVQMSGPVTIIVDFAVWLAIHIIVSAVISLIPAEKFKPGSWLFKERKWEVGGKIYEGIFKVKAWKEWLPDGAAIHKNGFRKKRLEHTHNDYLRRFILETCRAELTHLIIFIFALFFFIWNDWWIGLIMIAYALAVNMPCVITQRYNRIRLERIYAKQRIIKSSIETGNTTGIIHVKI